jgi:epsin
LICGSGVSIADPAMDFMKVIDQTVRELKREVNLKVLKVPEIEQKVLDATDDEPWGPHGSALAEIAQATKKLYF